jgi:hypothetical protein
MGYIRYPFCVSKERMHLYGTVNCILSSLSLSLSLSPPPKITMPELVIKNIQLF